MARRKNTPPEGPIFDDLGHDLDEIEPEWDAIRDDPSTIEAAPAPAPAKSSKSKRSTKKAKPKDPAVLPHEPPFHVHRFIPNKGKSGGRFMVIDTWTKKTPPTPIQLRDTFGPGRYQVHDALGNKKAWAVADFRPVDELADELDQEETIEIEAPTPPRIVPETGAPYAHTSPAPPFSQPHRQDHGATAAHFAPQAPPAWNPPPQYRQPPPPAAPAQMDPAMLSTVYRLDAAIQQISADQRRLQDELRSLVYELQQVPQRVAERVSSTISDAVDPFDQMTKVWAMSREMADSGYHPEKEGSDGLAGIIEGALGALAARGAPPALPAQAAPPQPPPSHQPRAPQPTPAPPPNGGSSATWAHNAPEPELPGMTDEIRQELLAHAAKHGLDYNNAIQIAKDNGITAVELLEIAQGKMMPPMGAPS